MGKLDLLAILKNILKALTSFKHIFLREYNCGGKEFVFKLEGLK
jgi:hypothetical protein